MVANWVLILEAMLLVAMTTTTFYFITVYTPDFGKTLSLSPADATFCIESEFSTRDDGFPGMTKAYGITASKNQIKMLDTGVISADSPTNMLRTSRK